MSKIQIQRAITVKARVTEGLKDRLVAELQAAIQRLEEENQQLESQVKRAELSMMSMTPQQQMQLRQAVDLEKQKRQAEMQELRGRIEEVRDLPLGSEIVQGQVQAVAEVGVGDNWDELYATEILVEDGKVIAIRRGS